MFISRLKILSLGLLVISLISSYRIVFSEPQVPIALWCAQSIYACIFNIVAIIFRIVYTLSFFLSAIFLAWGGILFITGGGDTKKLEKAKNTLLWAVIGLIVALLAWAVVLLIQHFVISPTVFVKPKFVLAQVSNISPPAFLKCGDLRVPSIFSNREASPESFEECIIFYLMLILTWVYQISLFFSIIMLIWAGINYITKPEKAKDTHKILMYAIIGAIVTVLAWTIVKAIQITLTE